MADHNVDDFEDILIIDIDLDPYIHSALSLSHLIVTNIFHALGLTVTSILHVINIYLDLRGWEHAIFTCIVLTITLIQLFLSNMLDQPETHQVCKKLSSSLLGL